MAAWSELPEELLSAIANSLTPNPIDILVFRSVCKSWRSSFPRLTHPSLLSPPFPLTLPRLTPPLNRYAAHSPASLTVTVIYALTPPLFSSSSSSSFPSWFLFLDEPTPAKLRLLQPFSDYTYLPSNFPKTITLIDFSPLELGRYYSLRYDYTKNTFCTKSPEVSKVVLFPDRFTVIALFVVGKLWNLNLNLEFGEWENVHDATEFSFDDIVEFKGRVLGVDGRGTVYEITHDSPEMNLVVPPIAEAGGRRKRLMESLGMLYLIVGFDADPTINEHMSITEFKVYELNEEKKEWSLISSIGDRSFFIGFDFSFSASMEDLATCGKNCIFFKESSFGSYGINYPHYRVIASSHTCINDCGIGVYHLNEDIRVGELGSYPEYSDVLWPPPEWIWGVDRLKRLEMLETPIDEVLANFSEDDKARFREQSIKILEGMLFTGGDRIVMDLLKLKEAINLFQEGDTKFIVLENKLQEPISVHRLREFIYMLDEIDNQMLQGRTSGSGNDSRLDWPDELKTALEQIDARDAAPSHLIRHVIRQRDMLLFKLEDFVSIGLSIAHYEHRQKNIV